MKIKRRNNMKTNKISKKLTPSIILTAVLIMTAGFSSSAFSQTDIHHSSLQNIVIYGSDTNSISLDRAEIRLSSIEKRYQKKNRALTMDEIKTVRKKMEKTRYNLYGKGIPTLMKMKCETEARNSGRFKTAVQRFNEIETWLTECEKKQNIEFISVIKKDCVYKII